MGGGLGEYLAGWTYSGGAAEFEEQDAPRRRGGVAGGAAAGGVAASRPGRATGRSRGMSRLRTAGRRGPQAPATGRDPGSRTSRWRCCGDGAAVADVVGFFSYWTGRLLRCCVLESQRTGQTTKHASQAELRPGPLQKINR